MIMYRKDILSTLNITKVENKRRSSKSAKDPVWYDNIFCFDIETTSAYITPDGQIIPYDFDRTEDFYTDCEKVGIMYIWMFGIDCGDRMEVIYGRTWEELREFFAELRKVFPHNIIVYVHNLAFEFQYLLNIFTFDHVFARMPHKVLICSTGNIHFRCSYFLVNMSLANWAKQKRLPVNKKTGDLDYNKIRTPLTELTEKELGYCEYDILVMYEGLKLFRNKYKHIKSIPLTQTGEIRRVLEKLTKNEVNFKSRNARMLPGSLADYVFTMGAFGGGDVHANYIYADKLQRNVHPYDIASSYPWACISENFMSATPVPVLVNRERFMDNPKFHYIILFQAEHIKCKLFNTWLSKSRTISCYGYQLDNGRVMSADYVCACMYKWDYEMFRDYYEIGSLEILELRVAPVRPMNDVMRKYIIDLYRDKTTLRGNDEYYEEYIFRKQCLNGIYGDHVQRAFDAITEFDGEQWTVSPIKDEEQFRKLREKKMREKHKMYKSVYTGIAIPSAARRNLWRGIIEPLDKQIVYFDTDSGKYLGNDIRGAVSSYNMHVYREHMRIAKELNINPSELSPAGPDGKLYPIGIFTPETADPMGYPEFKTLGAKKYAYLEDGIIHTTISGVPKKNSAKLNSVDDLNVDLYFTPLDCGRSIVYYKSDQPEIIFPDGFISRERFGICLQPTGYHMSLSKDYFALLINNRSIYDRTYDEMLEVVENG